ncbi:MAG: hypothetical protein CVT89_00220 [Candidatus Altiarchaeales archaeon HGW-Altiarchaeales-2]|nr:MAG: hypothetical protein CVT89_00220 [Candidatus Altiarchaeales archaeon HGW-Altiarchaeales-2]
MSKTKQIQIGKIPEEWEVANLEKVVEIYDSKRVPLSEMERNNRKGIYPYCGANGIIDYIDDYIFDGEFVLLAEDGGDYNKFGNSAYIMNGKFWVNNHAHILKSLMDKTINQFLFYCLNFVDLNSYIFGSTRKKLNQEQMRKIKLALPPFPEQKAIAEILLTADESIQKSNEIIAKTKLLKKGLMQELLTKGIGHNKFKDTEIGRFPEDWGVKTTTDLFCIETGTTPSTKQKDYWIDGVINWITPADMSKLDNDIGLKNSKRKITEKALKETNLTLMPENSIIISTRAPVGYVGLVKEETTFNQGCKGLIPKNFDEICSEFYCYYLLSKKQLLQNLSSGSTFKELSKNILEKLQIPFFSLPEQQKIAEILSTVDKKLELERKRKEKIERIKKGLMNDLLTGRKRIKKFQTKDGLCKI